MIGFRPVPEDGYPIIGPAPRAPDIHVAVTHSGVTLAPILGETVAAEVAGGQRVASLAPYRPERFGQG